MNDRTPHSSRPGDGGSDVDGDGDGDGDRDRRSEVAIGARIARHLDDRASAVPLADTPLEVIVRRGDQRRQRRTTAIGVLATVVLVGGVVVGVDVLSQDGRPHRITGGNSVTPDDSAPPDVSAQVTNADQSARIAPVASNLTWTVVTPTATAALSYGYVPYDAQAGGPLFAYATQPGTSPSPTRQFYRSDDGVNWTPVDGAALQIDGRAMAADAGHLYAVSTSAATATDGVTPSKGESEVVLSTSADSGATWSSVALEIDLARIAALAGVASATPGTIEVVAGNDGVLISVDVQVQFDLEDLSHGGSLELRPDGVIATPYTCDAGGIATVPVVASTVVVPAGADPNVVVASTAVDAGAPTDSAPTDTPIETKCTPPQDATPVLYPWTKLGIDQAAVDAYFAPPLLYVGSDGSRFSEVTHPDASSDHHVTWDQLFALPDGFALVSAEASNDGLGWGQRLFLSPDGETWTERTMPAGTAPYYVSSLGRTDDGSLVIVINAQDGPVADVNVHVSSDDGATWTIAGLDGLLTDADGVSAQLQGVDSSIGPTGITVVAGIITDPYIEQGPRSVTIDGVVVSQIDQQGTTVFTDAATGAELGRLSEGLGYLADGTFAADESVNAGRDPNTGDLLLYDADGSLRNRFVNSDLSPLWSVPFADSSRMTVLHSDDGVNWSRDDLAGIAGFDVPYVASFVATPSQLLVTVTNTDERNSIGTATTKVLVATPTT